MTENWSCLPEKKEYKRKERERNVRENKKIY